MKKYLLTMIMVLFVITTLSAISLFNKKNREVPQKEFTEQEIKDFCIEYFKASSKAQAKTQKKWNLDLLDDFYVNHTMEFIPIPINSDKNWIVLNEIEFVNIEKESNLSTDCEKKLRLSGRYQVNFYVTSFGIVENLSFIKKDVNKYETSYIVGTYDDKIKILDDWNTDYKSIRVEDIGILFESLRNKK